MNPLTKKQRLTPSLHFFFLKREIKKPVICTISIMVLFIFSVHFCLVSISSRLELWSCSSIQTFMTVFFIFIFNFFIPTRLVFRGGRGIVLLRLTHVITTALTFRPSVSS